MWSTDASDFEDVPEQEPAEAVKKILVSTFLSS
jgi:hypothetical protein